MKSILKTTFAILIAIGLNSCFTAGMSTISSYRVWSSDNCVLRKSFDKLWNEYPYIRLSSNDILQIIKHDEVRFNKIRLKGDSAKFVSNSKSLYPDIFRPTDNSVNYEFYYIKSMDGEVVYAVSINDFGYTLVNCINLKDNKIFSLGHKGQDKLIIKRYRKKFESDIKPKLDKEIIQSR